MVYSLTIPEILHESPFSLFTVQCEKKKLQAKKANKKRSIMRFDFSHRPCRCFYSAVFLPYPDVQKPKIDMRVQSNGCEESFFRGFRASCCDSLASLLWWLSGFASIRSCSLLPALHDFGAHL